MVKFKFTPERIAEAATVAEYIGALNGNLAAVLKLLPKMAVDAKGKYIVTVTTDEDGDIAGYEHMDDAERLMNGISPKRLHALAKDIAEALKQVVNPTSAGG